MVFEVPTEKYKKYKSLFDNENFPRTWVESAFEYKSVKLLVDEAKNPVMTILLYPYHAFIAGNPNTFKLAEMFDIIPEETEINVNEDKWL
jgi:hypothetical protein